MVSFGYVIPAFGPFADPGAAADLVSAGEDLGFDDVWFGDHLAVPGYAAHLTHPDWLEALTCCFIGLGRTRRLRFGTDVLVAPYRHPVVVAKMAATADHLSGGRLVLGFGVGYLRGEFAALGADFEQRGAVTDEYLEVLRLLWTSEGPVGYEGRHVSFADVHFGPRPAQDPMPLWVGGNIARARRRAALLGNGWHPLFPTPEQYAKGRAEILGLRESDEPFTFSFSCATTAIVDEPPAAVQTHTWGEMEGVPEDFAYAPPLPVDGDGRPRFFGTPDQVASDIEAYAGAGVEHFTLRFATGGPETDVEGMTSQMQRFATEVAPRFGSRRSP